ncbi:hypothetical protein HPP92_015253 [Vanilla planifolia]|uniref:Uncharacterized protein n=1 Tax=Vanilla planifolia TaxID=51239 RepID=A0A835UU05_VANPL|nr:hypothetical protein HPP92_015775 [Vanilla planifolia]KAG0475567.1 hypothetical protein HPP92_015253 [Vanilla planifolia]
MVSDDELASCVESLLRQGGPTAFTSVNGVVRQLEAKLGMDLSHKASFIHNQIDILLGSHFSQLSASTADATAASGLHFPENPIAASPFAHLSRHPHDPTFSFATPMTSTTAAAGVATQLNRNHYHPPAIITPGPAPQRTPVAVPKESAPAAPKRRGGPGGLSKVCGVSPELQAIVGEPTMARTEIVKQLWVYIRKNNLQDPSNKRKIICNDELRLVFETDSTDMFKMNKLLAKHIIPLEPSKETGPDSKRVKKNDGEMAVAPEKQAGQYPVVISDALAEFFCIGEREILQSEALRRVWDYIKANHLEDPLNQLILCDTKLKQLFGCESLSSSGLSEMLSHHLFKQA